MDKKNFWPWLLFFLSLACAAFATGWYAKGRVSLPDAENPAAVLEYDDTQSAAAESRGETVLRAIAKAYPDRTGEVEFYDGDWTIQVYGERFYFAGGRLLPASLLDSAREYVPQAFYNYQKELPPWTAPTEEESAMMRIEDRDRETRLVKRSSHFYDALWRTRDRDESWDRIKQIRFLGQTVQVHYSILEELSLVEEHILKAAKTSTAVRRWIDSIDSVTGWNWRNIAASESRSYHSYGVAVDILPRSLGGLATYWRWTAEFTPDWWAVPYSRRFHPPDEVIEAFELFGFIWGGKWRFYDTMHFEYRPEILVLSGMEQMDLRDLMY
jgi:hypothetical protein